MLTWQVRQHSILGTDGASFNQEPLFQSILHLVELTVAPVDVIIGAIPAGDLDDVCLQARHTASAQMPSAEQASRPASQSQLAPVHALVCVSLT